MSAPRKSSAGLVIGVICAVLLVALLAVVLVWVAQGKKPPAVAGGGRPSAAVPDAPPAAKPPAPKPDGNIAYLPAPGLRLTYHEQFVDGDEGDWELVTAHLNARVELSSVECLDSYATAGENDVATMHYLSDADGVWKVEDIRPENRELYLPTQIKPGATFSSEGVNGKIVAVGKTCDLGFTTFTDCLVVQRTYGAGYEETEYFAPGHGIVLTKAGNATMRKLTGVTRMDENEATTFVKKHTTWQKALGE